MTEDLTDNDLVLRQINYSNIIARLLNQRLEISEGCDDDLQYSADFYGDPLYWRRANITMRFVFFIFLFLYLTQSILIKTLLFLTKPLFFLQKSNLMIQLKRKSHKFDQTRKYLGLLIQADYLTNKKALVDYHFAKLAIYIEFNTRVCQLVFDTVIGVAIFLIVAAYPDFFINIVNYTCQLLHLEQLQNKIYWLLGNPAGFKPNANLAHFLGNFVLSLIRTWDHVTSALTNARSFIVLYIASVGWLGASL